MENNTPKVYEIPGEKIKAPDDFYRVIGEVINGPGGYFGRNLDAFKDCLSGDFGTPKDGRFTLRWLRSSESRAALGYPETIKWLEERLDLPQNRNNPVLQERLSQARLH